MRAGQGETNIGDHDVLENAPLHFQRGKFSAIGQLEARSRTDRD
jgi:hypothetical protein